MHDGTVPPTLEAGPPPDDRAARRGGLRLAVVVAGIALVVVGEFALRARSPAGTRGPDGGPPPASVGVPVAYGPAMPGGCEVAAGAPPVLVFADLPGDRLELGALHQDEALERKVTVRNAGRGVLCVRHVETGCGCVKATWDGDPHVPASGSGTLTLRVDTAALEGRLEKWVTLHTNDPRYPFGAVMTVAFDVRLGILVSGGPGLGSRLSFGIRPVGRPATAALRLRCARDAPAWGVLGVEPEAAPDPLAPTFTWELVPSDAGDPAFRTYELRITHPGHREPGRDRRVLRVRTSFPEQPELRVDAELTVVRKYHAAPPRADFGAVRGGAPAPPRTIEVRAGEPGLAFEVTSARVEGPGFVAGAPRRAAEGWTVDVRYDGAARAPGRVDATLVVTVDDPELPEVRVPLVAVATGG